MSSDNPQSDPVDLHSDAGVGGEVVAGTAKDTGGAATGAQDEPAMDLDAVSERERIDGIVAQTAADFPSGTNPDRIAHALRGRFRDAGIDVPDDEIVRLAGG